LNVDVRKAMSPAERDPSSDFLTGMDPVVEAYKKDVDRTLLRYNLRLTVEERFEQFESFMRYYAGRHDEVGDRMTLEQLVEVKRAAGGPKDLEAAAELEALLDGRGGLPA
jgi:hypothetical protein